MMPNKNLTSNFEKVLKDAIQYLLAGSDPFIPFASAWDNTGKRSVHTSFHLDYPQAVEQAFAYIKRNCRNATSYCVVWSGYVTTKEGRYDAIFMEAAEKDSPESIQVAQRYMYSQPENALNLVGDIIVMKTGGNLLNS